MLSRDRVQLQLFSSLAMKSPERKMQAVSSSQKVENDGCRINVISLIVLVVSSVLHLRVSV
jgi:hypothetical protein